MNRNKLADVGFLLAETVLQGHSHCILGFEPPQIIVYKQVRSFFYSSGMIMGTAKLLLAWLHCYDSRKCGKLVTHAS